METIIAIVALCIAFWQLRLQKNEIHLNGRINSLIHIATMIKDKITYHEQIIQSLKNDKKGYSGHASRVNNELRPMLLKVHNELMSAIANHKGTLDISEIRQALKLNDE